MAGQTIRIKLKSYDHELVDGVAKNIVDVITKNGAKISGPIPLPTEREVVTILRATHKYKDSREQFETRTHKRLIDQLPFGFLPALQKKNISDRRFREPFQGTRTPNLRAK